MRVVAFEGIPSLHSSMRQPPLLLLSLEVFHEIHGRLDLCHTPLQPSYSRTHTAEQDKLAGENYSAMEPPRQYP
jgi:hypothetical protein